MKAEQAQSASSTQETLDVGIRAALDWLDAAQNAEGYWSGWLGSNSCMEAEWLLALHVLGVEDEQRTAGLVRAILNEQREDGAWEVYYQAPAGDINATVECYAALRAAGFDLHHRQLVAARRWILAHGGLGGTRVFTRYWLALIGEWPWQHTPNIPPEMIWLPRWFVFNIYYFACWARTTLLPLAVLSARRYSRPLPAGRRLDELFPQGREHCDYALPRKGRAWSWAGLFRLADRLFHVLQRLGLTPGREAAIRHCLEWIIRHQDADGTWGGIQPPWIYSLMALRVEGYALDHPVVAGGLAALEAYRQPRGDAAIYIQASESPVWDTLLALLAMQDCGRRLAQQPATRRALDWVLAHQAQLPGDWSVRLTGVDPGGWAFQRANRWYPDIDDTAVGLMVLAQLEDAAADPRIGRALTRARGWLLAMQSANGGWAAFDRDNDRKLLTSIPFCDFGEALDPPSADVTAHVLEALALTGMDGREPAVARALGYLYAEQEQDGSWFGRWGVNHLYGTAAVLPALRALGEEMSSSAVRRAAGWLAGRQNEDGGWGESCASYMDPAWRGRGPSTASQTGWALLGLLAVDGADHLAAIRRGVEYLLGSQRDGTWQEPYYTGTGFPGYWVGARTDLTRRGLAAELRQGRELGRAFMINYGLYRHYFPLMALGRARRRLADHGMACGVLATLA